jgi:2-iminoacetate synthase
LSFKETLSRFNWQEVKELIYSKTKKDVEFAIKSKSLSIDDFAALLSPAAENYIEEMAQESHRITLMRFGKTIKIYAPLYLSNECSNSCIYCGFNRHNDIARVTLNEDEIRQEAEIIASTGVKHILLVTGEAPKKISIDYLVKAVTICKEYFSSISIEIYPLSTQDYSRLYEAGVDGLTVYQETYNKQTYAYVHPAGKKSDFDWRLDTPERGAKAGLRTVGIGILMGLDDFRVEEFFVGLHASYLIKKYWKTHFTVSFPRIRKAEGAFTPENIVTDINLVQSMLALRLFLNDVGLVISTREPAHFRDKILPLGVTQMSAGSKTDPGGYALHEKESGEQFEVEDKRSVSEFTKMLREKGYDPVMKDWDISFLEKDFQLKD